MCYHFCVYNELVFYLPWQEQLGQSLIGFVIGLLAFNSVIILTVNVVVIRKHCRRFINRREHKRKIKEREKAKLLVNVSFKR